ncbi:MAG TPA: helix-turn-helix domain-containing protein [Phycisphaerae bacterium]
MRLFVACRAAQALSQAGYELLERRISHDNDAAHAWMQRFAQGGPTDDCPRFFFDSENSVAELLLALRMLTNAEQPDADDDASREPTASRTGATLFVDKAALLAAGGTWIDLAWPPPAAAGSRTQSEAGEGAATGPAVDEDEDREGAPTLRIDDAALLAYWGDLRLNINAHADFKVLRRLNESLGAVVPYASLLRAVKPDGIVEAVSKVQEAPPEVKDAVTHIKAAFRAAACPWKLENVRGEGYRLSPDE